MEKCFTSYSKKVKSKQKITPVENNEIISEESETAESFKNYFDKIVGNRDINRNLECFQESFKGNTVLTSVEKYASHSNIRNNKIRMHAIDSNCSFKFVDQDQVFKEIKKLDGNKASKNMIFQSK